MALKVKNNTSVNTVCGQLSLLDFEVQPGERIVHIPLSELFAPDPHPFLVTDDDAMARLVESITLYGVREPGLARPNPDGGYELLCGNRPRRACQIVGLATMPVIVRDLGDPPALLFGLHDGFHWECVNPNIFAEYLFSKKNNKGRPAEKRDSVKAEIQRLLENGEPIPSAELEQKVIDATGCSVRTLKSAKEDLGVKKLPIRAAVVLCPASSECRKHSGCNKQREWANSVESMVWPLQKVSAQ
ncbi:MAG: ParB N-terminal domain-containing protein [Oscillospiraceae bacterium]|jgi:hypothetical protein|nr:ParB N-terminal domain-containing protein [Oscillospiraceae bacterium]